MGGKDDDKRSDFDRLMGDVDKELANTVKELEVVMNEIRRQLPNPHDAFDDIRKQLDRDDVPRTNPFERFKGFVDSNFALLSDGFKRFPSNIRELKQRMQEEREARRAEELDVWRRWTGSEDSPDHIRMQVDRASKGEKEDVKAATFMLLRESFERNKHVPAQKILELYRDDEWGFGSLDQFATPMLSFGGACYYKPETVENLPSTARWGWPAATQKWLSIEWFKRSPYSPIRLEAHPNLEPKGEKWRAAFEDLLLVSLDKTMQTTEKIGQRIPRGKPQSTYHGPGLDWMLSLQCRGILPPQLPSLYQHYRHETGRQWFKPAHTRVLPDLDAITSQRSHCKYPRAEADIAALMDEVGIQAQPDTDGFSQLTPAMIPQSAWRVPDTEAELYEQMEPQLPAECATPLLNTQQEDDFIALNESMGQILKNRDFNYALDRIFDYEKRHGKEDALLNTVLASMSEDEIDNAFEHLTRYDNDIEHLRRFGECVDRRERREQEFQQAKELWPGMEDLRASGLPPEKVGLHLYLRELEVLEEQNKRRIRTANALAKAEKLGYDFKGWDWDNLPIEELEAELERESASTESRRKTVLAKAARLGYDFNGWGYDGLPVQELEDELLRMEQYAKRDGQAQQQQVVRDVDAEVKRPDVLSQLTTTETVRMPDGTVTTKVVLKRRFADGREETKETVHTSNEALEAQAAEEKARVEAERKREGGKGKGWFWT